MLDPILRRRYGVGALAMSAIFIGLSFAGGAATAMRRDAVADDLSASQAQCEKSLEILGATSVSSTDERLVAEWPGVEGGYSAIGNASAGAMSCPGWKMSKFCMGSECPNAGVMLELERLGG